MASNSLWSWVARSAGLSAHAARALLVPLVVAACLVPGAVEAAMAPEVEKGLAWLASQVQADGQLSGEATSAAVPFQARAETASSFTALGQPAPAALLAAIAADGESATEQMARRLMALDAADPAVPGLLVALTSRQNADGGFGGGAGFASTGLDTAWAALAMVGKLDPADSRRVAAAAFLEAGLAADGGMVSVELAGRIHVSALALIALQTTGNATGSAVSRLSGWLLLQQQADGSWAGDPYLTAQVLTALRPLVADTGIKSVASGYLLFRQQADGSWQEDPFLTAVILRALAGGQGGASAGAAVAGTVVDAATGVPLAGAEVSVSGAGTDLATRTDGSGAFSVTGLAAGSYQLTISQGGQAVASRQVTLATGQTVNLGTVAATAAVPTASVAGTVTDAASGRPLAGAMVAIAGAANYQAITDAAGNYAIGGIAPGAVTVTASLAGYRSANGAASLAAGQLVRFSPFLYAEGSAAPGSGSYRGRVVSAASGEVLAGVALVSAGATLAATGADGRFDLPLAAGSYTVAFVRNGYGTLTQGFVVTEGTLIDAGTVALSPLPTSTSLRGRVLAGTSPIANATVQLIGGASAQSGADGAYRLDNLGTGRLSVRASATGYASQTYVFDVPAPTEIVQDLRLAALDAQGVAFGNPLVSPALVPANTPVTIAVTLANQGATALQGALMLRVTDATGTPVSVGEFYAATGEPLGTIELAPGASLELVGKWNSGQFAPGEYGLGLRLVQPGSMTRSRPLGDLIVERQGNLTIGATTRFSGSAAAEPPVIRAGLGQNVALNALLRNEGNVPLPLQSYVLTITDSKALEPVFSATAVGVETAAAGLLSLDFGHFTPTTGGDYRLDVAAAVGPALGQASGKLYVGDAAQAIFTVDKPVVPTGSQTVRGKLSILGQDVAHGSISDPLAPVIRAAVQKAVTYNDTQARVWTLNNRCQGCHVQSQAMVGGEANFALATFDQQDRSIVINNTAINQRESGDLAAGYSATPRTVTMLGLWALTSYHSPSDIGQTIKKAADWIASAQTPVAGWWQRDYYSGWYGSELAPTAINLKSLAASWRYLTTSGQAETYFTTEPYLPSFTRPVRGFVTLSDEGGYYLSGTSGDVVQLSPDGTVVRVWTGLNDPRGILESRVGGGIIVATQSGLFRLQPDGTTTVLQPELTDIGVLTYGPDGKIYASGWNNRIYRLDESGVAEVWVAGNPLNRPLGLTFDSDGSLLVANYNSGNIVRYASDKSYRVLWQVIGEGNVLQVAKDGDYWLVAKSTGLFRFNKDWVGQRLLYEPIHQFQRTPDGSLLTVWPTQNGLRKVTSYSSDISASLAAYAQAIGWATDFLMAREVEKNDSMQLAHQLLGLGEAHRFYRTVDAARADAVWVRMGALAQQLRGNQQADGGWEYQRGLGSDALATAQVGYALDYTNPSPGDSSLRKAIAWLLTQQHGDGSWSSYSSSTNLAATTWVSIWLPVILDRIGGIDTEVSLTFPAEVAMSNANPAPTTTETDSSGNLTARWQLTGVTSQGREIGFDLTLADLTPNEERPVASDAHLTFNNSFTNQPVSAPIAVPVVRASAFLNLGLTTDRPSYGADTAVLATAAVANTGEAGNGGSVVLQVLAADGSVIAELGRVAVTDLAAGATGTATAAWNTGRWLAGPGYRIRATLYDLAERFVATTEAAFAIVGSDTATGTGGSQLALDKTSYQASDQTTITSRVTNRSANQLLENLSLTVTVANAAGATLYTRTTAIAQLPAGTSAEFISQYAFTAAPAGSYTVSQTLTDAMGALIDTQTRSFTVRSSASDGFGLTGALAATPGQVPLGEPVSLTFTASNAGNAGFAALPINLRLLDPARGAVLATIPRSTDLPIGGSFGGNEVWLPAGVVAGDTLVAALSATVAGREIALAQTSFKIVAPPIKLELVQGLERESRLLVLAACSGHGEGSEAEHHDDRDEHPVASRPGHASERDCDRQGDGHDEGDDDHQGHDDHQGDGHSDHGGKCGLGRAQAIDALLDSLAIAHRVTTDPAIFRRELRSGAYTGYWISGRVAKLKDDLAQELREAAFRGETLIEDGVHDERNKVLDAVAGVRIRGKYGEQNLPVVLAAPFAEATLASLGRGLRVESAGAVPIGSFGTGGPPAVLAGGYGWGRSLFFGLDLVASLAADPAWGGQFGLGLDWLLPPSPERLLAGGYLPLVLSVDNLAQAAEVELKLTLPAGVTYIGAQPEPASRPGAASTQAVWRFALPAGNRQAIHLALRAPLAAGELALTTELATVKNGTVTPYGEPRRLPFTVVAVGTQLPQVQALVAALAVSGAEKSRRDKATARIGTARSALAAGRWGDAITALIEATDHLRQITSIDTAPLRLAVDQALSEAQWRWVATQP